ncbi:MAG: methyltransferase domain-containing protein [Candidatus Kaiserbacteria bacterium]|nr:methyltransferase domain-containing protein [Candidatus Kaiserbacteria bacterium]
MNNESGKSHGQSSLKYSDGLVDNYTNTRERFNETDSILFSKIHREGGVMGKRVLDLGCGDGSHAIVLKEMGACEVFGIDINEAMLRRANQKLDGVEGVSLILANGASLPFQNDSFDFIISNYVIQYFKDVTKVFAEIGRVLNSGGTFIGTINVIEVEAGYENLHNTEIPIRLGSTASPVIVRFFVKSVDEISMAIENSGLTVVEEEEMTHPNSVIDESYPHHTHVKKHAMIYTLRKI